MLKLCRFAAAIALAGGLVAASTLAQAASFDCSGQDLSEAQQLICADQELSRLDDRVARRIQGMQKRYGLGLYLSMRYWHYRNRDLRDACGRDRPCIVATYRAQGRTLDRLQGCLDNSVRKRSCMRVALSADATTPQNTAGKPAP